MQYGPTTLADRFFEKSVIISSEVKTYNLQQKDIQASYYYTPKTAADAVSKLYNYGRMLAHAVVTVTTGFYYKSNIGALMNQRRE